MGSACGGDSEDSSRLLNTDDSKERSVSRAGHDNETIFGINTHENVTSYDVGAAIDIYARDGMKQLSGNDPARWVKIFSKYNLFFYWWSSIAYICKSDGKLDKKEKKYIKKRAHEIGITSDEELNKIYLANDHIDDMISELPKFWQEFDSNLTKKEINIKILMCYDMFLLYALIAATQDGLVLNEYKTIKKIGQRLSLPNPSKNIKECIKLIKLEKQLAVAIQTRQKRK